MPAIGPAAATAAAAHPPAQRAAVAAQAKQRINQIRVSMVSRPTWRPLSVVKPMRVKQRRDSDRVAVAGRIRGMTRRLAPPLLLLLGLVPLAACAEVVATSPPPSP